MPTLAESRQRAKDEKLQAHKLADNLYRVYNVVKGTSYDVVRSVAGSWSCTCPYAVKGSRLNSGDCKHLTRVEDRENGCVTCHVQDDTIRNGKCSQCRFYDKME